jgi:hypothetical protein
MCAKSSLNKMVMISFSCNKHASITLLSRRSFPLYFIWPDSMLTLTGENKKPYPILNLNSWLDQAAMNSPCGGDS